MNLLWPRGARQSQTDERPVRLLACQGSVQLAAAISAIRSDEELHGASRNPRNILVVHRLAAPGSGQEAEFVEAIRQLASQSLHCERVHYLNLQYAAELNGIWRNRGWQAAARALRSKLEIPAVNELVLGQNINIENCLLASAYPHARRVGYGDGVGVNFTRDYYRPGAPREVHTARPKDAWWKFGLGRRSKTVRRFDDDELDDVEFADRYLLLPNLFDEQARDFQAIAPATLRRVFAEFGEHPDLANSAAVRTAEEAIRRAPRSIVLLTSNFAETSRMELEREVDCCVEMAREVSASPDSAIVIKPHPRDSHEKIRLLQSRLRQLYREVVIMADAITFYAPFEAIVERYQQSIPRFVEKTTMICVSSSCLGLAYLYGCRCRMGFGETRVRQHFSPVWKELRLRHEQDLVTALRGIQQRFAIADAA